MISPVLRHETKHPPSSASGSDTWVALKGLENCEQKNAKDSSSPSGPFMTHKDLTRGAEATRCISEIPQCWICAQSYQSLSHFYTTCTCNLAEKLRALNGSCFFSRWSDPLSQSQPAQTHLARSLLCNGREPTRVSYSKGHTDFFTRDQLPSVNSTFLLLRLHFTSRLCSKLSSVRLCKPLIHICLKSGHRHWIMFSAEGNKISHSSDCVF